MAADLTSTVTVYEQDTGASEIANSPFEYKEILVETPNTADSDDTFDITLATYGITNVKSVQAWIHATTSDVMVLEEPNTSVTTGVLTVTLGGSSADDQTRTVLIGGY